MENTQLSLFDLDALFGKLENDSDAKNNSGLHNAKAMKNDEFYTMLSDIEDELKHYKDFFKGKIVYCNCDDARESNFFKYFVLNFETLGLKKLIATGYKKYERGVVFIYDGSKKIDIENIVVDYLNGNGDFRSDECVEFLKEADVVVTNPPFSLFRLFVTLLMEYGKKFLILGNQNAITYKEVFPHIKNNELWLGVNSNKVMEFSMPLSYEKYDRIEGDRKYGKVPAISWFTNIPHDKRSEEILLNKEYNPENYKKYDNYNAIEVSKVSDIPINYDGIMGVPITFLGKYNPNQFEIIGHEHDLRGTGNSESLSGFKINGTEVYKRILIRRK